MVTVVRWTGHEVRVLRNVLRMSVRDFSNHTNLSASAIADMEAKGEQAQLRHATQQVLDEVLAAASEQARQRFGAVLGPAVLHGSDTAANPRLASQRGAAHSPVLPTAGDRETSIPLNSEPTDTVRFHSLPDPAGVGQAIEESLNDGSPYADRLERLRQRVHEHAADVATVAPTDMINRVAPDLIDAHRMLRYARTAGDAQLLRTVLARISAVVADEFSVLGSIRSSRAWYTTAMTAADRSESVRLQAVVRALGVMLPLYHGRQADAVRLAQQAQQLAGTAPCFAVALASMLEALAYARLGDHDQARLALRRAQDAHDSMDDAERAESIFSFSVRRRLFYEGRVLTMVGDYAAAEAVHRQARELYPPQVVGDPAIMSLDRAAALIDMREFDTGAHLIMTTLSSLPADHQIGIFLSLANRAFAAIPIAARKLPGPRACAELLDTMSNVE